MLDLKPATDDQHRPNTNVLTEENGVQPNLNKYIQKQPYRQPPIYVQHATTNRKYHELASVNTRWKSALHSNILNRFQAFQNKLSSQLQAQDRLQNKLQNLRKNLIIEYEKACESLKLAKTICTKSYRPFLAAILIIQVQQTFPYAIFFNTTSLLPTIRHEPKPHWYTNDTDVEANLDENNDLGGREIPYADEPKQRLNIMPQYYLRNVRNKPYKIKTWLIYRVAVNKL